MPTSRACTVEPEEGNRGVVYLISRFILRPLFLLLFRPHIRGRENVPATGPFIIASNHLSFIDSFAIPIAAPRPVSLLAKSDYFTGTGVSGAIRRVYFEGSNAIPVDRHSSRAATSERCTSTVGSAVSSTASRIAHE